MKKHTEDFKRETVRIALTSGLSRDWLSELLVDFPHDEATIAWLLRALEATAPKKLHELDPLGTTNFLFWGDGWKCPRRSPACALL